MDTNLIILLIGIGFIISIIIIIPLVIFVISRMKGKLDIILNNYNYSFGDTINGQVNLTLKKPIEATSLNIKLIGEKQNMVYSKNVNDKSNKQVIFNFAQPIDGQKLYPVGEQIYNFSIQIPKNVNTNLEGIAGNIVKSIQILSGNNSVTKWYLLSTFEAKGVNLNSKKVQININ